MKRRLQKLHRIRKRQHSMALAELSESQIAEQRIETEITRTEDAVDALTGQAVTTFDLESLAHAREVLELHLRQARVQTQQREERAARAAVAESRAETLYSRYRTQAAAEATRVEQKLQDDRGREEERW